jgi:hypothetical protein
MNFVPQSWRYLLPSPSIVVENRRKFQSGGKFLGNRWIFRHGFETIAVGKEFGRGTLLGALAKFVGWALARRSHLETNGEDLKAD